MSAVLPLRSYQTEAIAELHRRWDAGDTRVPMVLATGLGKTVIFSHLIVQWLAANPGKRALALGHTDEIVSQIAKKIKDVAPHLHIGIVKAERNDVTARVIVASVQSLRSKQRRAQIRNVGLIIVDECFPAGTLIGGKSIETLKPGDLVPSWDEVSGQEVMRPVVALMKNRPSGMVRVTMDDGTDFACTPNHPIMTTSGWCPAGGLWRGASVVSFTHDASARGEMYGVRRSGDLDREAPDRHISPERPDVLPNRMPGHVGETGSIGQDGADQSEVRIDPDDRAQSDEPARDARQDGGHAEADQSSASLTWREWQTSPGAASETGGVPRLANRGHRRAGGYAEAVSLQDRYSASDDESVRGSGRGIPLLAGPPSLRPAAGRKAVTARVVSIQVLEPGSDGTYGGVCPDGFVYNIEVAGTHTYLVGERGTLAHNCHHATAATYRAILDYYGAMDTAPACEECRLIGDARCDCRSGSVQVAGFTATLARGDRQKLSDIWQECTFQRGIAFGIRRGYLLDVRGKRIVVPDLDLSTVKKSGGDYQDAALGNAMDAALAPAVIADAYLEYAKERKGLAFWPLVATAEHGARAFNDAGIPSAVVHGGTPREERRLILKKLHTGDIQVVHNCGVLTEGFDEPTVSCVVNARPTQSAPLYQQMVGRGLRPDLSLPPDRRGDCLVLDVVGVSRTHNLRTLIDLSEREDVPDEMNDELSLMELEDLLEQEMQEAADEAGIELGPEEYYGQVAAEDFDPLARAGIGAWLQTAGGTYFLPVGNSAYVLIVPGEEVNSFDVAWLSQSPAAPIDGKQGDFTEHTGLSLPMACGWAEEVMEELGGTAPDQRGKQGGWRRRAMTRKQADLCRRLGIQIVRGWTYGDANDAIDVVMASARVDPVVGFLAAARGQLQEA